MVDIIVHRQPLFLPSELECPCCGKSAMDPLFMEKLIFARSISNVIYVLNSAYRCPDHNIEVGSCTSNHIVGKAVDIKCMSDRTRFIIIKALIVAGITGIGIAKTYIHADTNRENPAMWTKS